MAFAKIDDNGRIVAWSYEHLHGYDIEFQNGSYIDATCVDGLDDFVIREGIAYFEPTAEKLSKREQAERQAEQQELINALPDAVADLSVMVSDNAIDTTDLQDALAELSEIVSGLME